MAVKSDRLADKTAKTEASKITKKSKRKTKQKERGMRILRVNHALPRLEDD
jgi:hypothetical protein